MTEVALTMRPSIGLGRRVDALLSTEALAGITLVLLWALAHGFVGIEHDARIYMGRALADVDPAGVGHDILFQMDGQSSFSVFRGLAHAAAAAFGLGPTVLLLSLVNMLAWFAAVTVLARAVLPGQPRVVGVALACVCVLSRQYTPWHLIGVGESIPVPRPLAEAGVLLAMAALCRGRTLAATGYLVGAALFHPIMAAPGLGVLLVVLGLHDRRWFALSGLGAVCVVAAGALGLPLVARLVVTIDPAWRAVLVERNPYLFVGLWPVHDALNLFVVRGVTIGLAAAWLSGSMRAVFVASLVVGFLGLAASYLLGDLCLNLLIVQAQLWRAVWLAAAIAPLAAAICLWRLPRLGPAGQITLALLTIAWINFDWFPLAPLCAALALATYLGAPHLSFRLDRRAVLAAWLFCGLLVVCEQVFSLSALVAVVRSLPAGLTLPVVLFWPLQVATVSVMLLVFAWYRWPDRRATRIGAALTLVVGLVLVATQWNCQTAAKADLDAASRKPDLMAMLASRQGSLLWTEGDDAWYWAGRPIWNGNIQGSAIVFSRDLTMIWRTRAQAVVDAGLATRYLLTPLDFEMPRHAPTLDAARLTAFCRSFDRAPAEGPAWIVTPLDLDTRIPDGLGIRVWSPPLGRWKLAADASGLYWRHLDRYAITPCAGVAPRL